jgi:preprotein translocase subunit SecG
METFMTIVVVLSSLVLIGSVLMQSGKSAGLSGSIGGGAEQLFGKQKGRGYNDLFDRITKIAAVAFILCTLLLVYLQGR